MSFYKEGHTAVNSDISACFDKDSGVLRIWGKGSLDADELRGAFDGAELDKTVKKLIIEGEIIRICRRCFYQFHSLETVKLCDSVRQICNEAFFECTSLKSVAFPACLDTIGRSAFENCSSLRTLELPDSVKYAGEYAFAYCENLFSVVLPKGLAILPQQMFLCCSELESVRIAEGTEDLGDSTFSGCGKIKTVFLPSTLKCADCSGLSLCAGIENVYYASSEENWKEFIAKKRAISADKAPFGNAAVHFRPDKKKITKIVLTGAPCGGKTAALETIKDVFGKKGYAVVVIHETATELISGGISPVTLGSVTEFQKYVLTLQLQKEETVCSAIDRLYSDKVLVVLDRGAVDNMAYLSADRFREVFACTGTNKQSLIDRYDAVFQLITAANGAIEYYTTANNSARSEKPEDAIALDDSLTDAWGEHPYFRVIDNSTDFKGKMDRLIKEIEDFLDKQNTKQKTVSG